MDLYGRVYARITGNRASLNFKVNMMKQAAAGLMVGVLLAGSLPASADDGERRRDGRHWEDRHWEGREIQRFGDRDLGVWQGGHWRHGRHDGRLGWWWIAAGVWYFYPRPAYPYPDPYTPPVVVVNQPPAAVVPPPPPVIVQPQPAARLWYYCDSAKGYYPYVPSCAEGWQPVAAQPPAAAPR